MTATSFERDSNFAGLIPANGTYPAATNSLFLGGTIVCVRASNGQAYVPTDGQGYPAVGVAKSTYDNRTTAPEGGAAGAINVEVAFGVFGLKFTGSTPVPGQVVYVVDNQTVSTDSDSGQRGIAGYVSEVVGTTVFVQMGPTVAGQIVIAASEASQLDTAQADIDELQANVVTAAATVNIPLTSWGLSTGAPLAVFADGASTTPGLSVTDSEARCIRWNNHATPGAIVTSVPVPYDLDDTKDAILEIVASKTGATVGDAVTFLVAAYCISVGDLHDADADMGGTTNALVGNATAKTTAKVTRTFTAANIPANPAVLNLSVTPTAGTLGTDDLLVHSTVLRYTRKMLAA